MNNLNEQPVDLANLRDMTGNDKEMEKLLFEEFFLSSEQCISTLAHNCTSGENEIWRSNAHALKGTSINLGAKQLSALCKDAQHRSSDTKENKEKMLEAIKNEYDIVKEYLQGIE